MTRYLPDADELVRQAILGALPTANVGTQIPTNLIDRFPYIVARAIPGGGGPVHPKFAGRARVQVDVYSDSREIASDTCESVRVAINEAWRTQATFPAGRISNAVCTSEPTEVPRPPDAAQGVYRFQAIFRLVVR